MADEFNEPDGEEKGCGDKQLATGTCLPVKGQ